jgi:hypothetical protein
LNSTILQHPAFGEDYQFEKQFIERMEKIALGFKSTFKIYPFRQSIFERTGR